MRSIQPCGAANVINAEEDCSSHRGGRCERMAIRPSSESWGAARASRHRTAATAPRQPDRTAIADAHRDITSDAMGALDRGALPRAGPNGQLLRIRMALAPLHAQPSLTRFPLPGADSPGDPHVTCECTHRLRGQRGRCSSRCRFGQHRCATGCSPLDHVDAHRLSTRAGGRGRHRHAARQRLAPGAHVVAAERRPDVCRTRPGEWPCHPGSSTARGAGDRDHQYRRWCGSRTADLACQALPAQESTRLRPPARGVERRAGEEDTRRGDRDAGRSRDIRGECIAGRRCGHRPGCRARRCTRERAGRSGRDRDRAIGTGAATLRVDELQSVLPGWRRCTVHHLRLPRRRLLGSRPRDVPADGRRRRDRRQDLDLRQSARGHAKQPALQSALGLACGTDAAGRCGRWAQRNLCDRPVAFPRARVAGYGRASGAGTGDTPCASASARCTARARRKPSRRCRRAQ